METLTKAVNLFALSNPLRDIIITVGGLMGLFFLLAFAGGAPSFFEIAVNIGGRVELDILILVFCYVLGRLTILASDLILGTVAIFIRITVFLFFEDLPLKVRLRLMLTYWGSNYPQIMRHFLLGEGFFEKVSEDDVRDEVTFIDFAKAVKDFPLIGNTMERYVITLLVLRFVLVYSLIAAMLVSHYFYILFIVSLFQHLITKHESWEKEGLIRRGLAKGQSQPI